MNRLTLCASPPRSAARGAVPVPPAPAARAAPRTAPLSHPHVSREPRCTPRRPGGTRGPAAEPKCSGSKQTPAGTAHLLFPAKPVLRRRVPSPAALGAWGWPGSRVGGASAAPARSRAHGSEPSSQRSQPEASLTPQHLDALRRRDVETEGARESQAHSTRGGGWAAGSGPPTTQTASLLLRAACPCLTVSPRHHAGGSPSGCAHMVTTRGLGAVSSGEAGAPARHMLAWPGDTTGLWSRPGPGVPWDQASQAE